ETVIVVWCGAARLGACAGAPLVLVRVPAARGASRPAPCAAFALAPLVRPLRLQWRGWGGGGWGAVLKLWWRGSGGAGCGLTVLWRQRHLDPRLGSEDAPSVVLDIAACVGFDLIAWATLLTVTDIEHLALVVPEQRHDLVDDVASALSPSRSDQREIFRRDTLQHSPSSACFADDVRRRLAAPAVNARHWHSLNRTRSRHSALG